MLGLITDRDQAHVDRRNTLAAKGWNAMTDEERAEWTGNILTPALAGHSGSVNLMPNNTAYSDSVELKFKNREIVATANTSGIYLYSIVTIGAAANFVNRTMTLSIDSVVSAGNGTPFVAVYWHDANGYEAVGASLSAAGSVTFNAGANTGGRDYLALYIYVATDVSVSVGDNVRYIGVMLADGSERKPYVPYTQTLPTPARKGSYNYSDLNRVEIAVAELSDELGLGLTTKTDWTEWDIPTQADMDRFLSNIRAIRAGGSPLANTPYAPSSMAKLTYASANNIEKILDDIDISATNLFRCGELFCGEV